MRQGTIRGVDWSPDPRDAWIIVLGAFRLPRGRFNLPDCNLKLPLPATLYDPVPGEPGRHGFYSTILLDERLRERGPGGWQPVRRQYLPNAVEAGKGWAFLCMHPGTVGQDTDIRAVFQSCSASSSTLDSQEVTIMGKLATRTAGGTRLIPQNRVTVLDLQREREIVPSEVVYEITPSGPRDLKPADLVEPGRVYGVVPDNEVG